MLDLLVSSLLLLGVLGILVSTITFWVKTPDGKIVGYGLWQVRKILASRKRK